MQYFRFQDSIRVLSTRLAPFPHLEIEAGGMAASSVKNWYRIHDRLSGKRFTVLSAQAADFQSARFTVLLTRFINECGYKTAGD